MTTMSKQFKSFKKNQFLAYMSGLIDGDGYIGIKYEKGKDYYTPVVEILLIDRNIIELCQERLGGYFSQKGKYFRCTWRDRQALNLLMKIRNCLVLKGEQAKTAIKLQLLKNVRGNNKRDARKDRKKKELYELIKTLNHQKMESTSKRMSISNFYPYLAGIVDSEGCITSRKVKRGCACSTLIVSTTDKALYSFIKQRIGFGFYGERKSRLEYTIEWSSGNFLKIIRKIKKLLIIKKEQAEVAEKLQQRKIYSYTGKKLPQKEIDIRQKLVKKLKELKRAA